MLVGHSMGGFVAASLVGGFRIWSRVWCSSMEGCPFPPRVGIDTDSPQAIEQTLGPALQRLGRTFPSRDAYRRFWQAHPCAARGGAKPSPTTGLRPGRQPARTGDPRCRRRRSSKTPGTKSIIRTRLTYWALLQSGAAPRGIPRAARPAARALSRGGAGALAQPTPLADHRGSTPAEPLHHHLASSGAARVAASVCTLT